MKLLLDENMNPRFRHYLSAEHDVRSVGYMGWLGKVNGELLARARDEFDVLITLDQNMECQQNLTAADVAVIVLRAGTDDIKVLLTLVPQIYEQLHTVRRGRFYNIPPKDNSDDWTD